MAKHQMPKGPCWRCGASLDTHQHGSPDGCPVITTTAADVQLGENIARLGEHIQRLEYALIRANADALSPN